MTHEPLFIHEPPRAALPEPMCGAEFRIEEDRLFDELGYFVGLLCEMPRGHAGAHMDDSMAGRVAWMTREEVLACEPLS